MDSEQLNRIRFHKLKAERLLQIKREGVLVHYFYGGMSSRSFFQFSFPDYKKAHDLINQNKFFLQICESTGQPLQKFQSQQLYMNPSDNDKLYISQKRKFLKLQDGQSYYIVKRNPSNSVYLSIYSNDGQVYEKSMHAFSESLKDYIEGNSSEVKIEEMLSFDYQEDMNQAQNLGIRKVGENGLTFIKGPPGCGKTKTIGRLCRLLIQKQQLIIVGTVSNIGNLSILRQIIKQISIYNNHSLLQQIQLQIQSYVQGMQQFIINQQQPIPINLVYFTPLQSKQQNRQLDVLTRYYSLNQYLLRNILKLNVHYDWSLRQIQMNLECIVRKQSISSKFYSIYMQAFAKTVREAHIIVSTTVISASINERLSQQDHFCPNAAILDEAAQASWADTFCYLKFNVNRLVLVGDQNQLDPTVISQDKVLKETVFGKLSKNKEEYFVMLDTQYRMHPQIAQFPNFYFYGNQLKNGVSAQDRKSDIEHFKSYPTSFVSHNYLQNEYIETDIQSKGKRNYYNLGQLTIVHHILSYFPKEQLKNVGIITPYSLQLKTLSEAFMSQILNYGLTVKTCDGYQGGEKDYIIVSCVRSNLDGKIGFCGERNRINVTLTRAKKGLVIIGNTHTLSEGIQYEKGQNVWAALIEYMTYKNKVIYYQPPQIDQIDQRIVSQYDISNSGKSYENSLKVQMQTIQNETNNNSITIVSKESGQLQQNLNDWGEDIYEKLKKLGNLIKFDEDEEQIETLLARNKKQVKQMRKLSPFCSQSKDNYDLEQCQKQLSSIFADIPITKESICLRLTKTAYQQLCCYYQQNDDPIDCDIKLHQIISNLSPSTYQNNHILESQNIYKLIKLSLFKLLVKLLQ